MTQEVQAESTALANAVMHMAIDTGNFNEAITALPFPNQPTLLDGDRLQWAMAAFREEIKEFQDATEVGDIVEASDGLIDLVYFALGRLHEMGIPATAVWEAVHKKNMEKKRGQLSKRPGSKGHDAVKPEGWTPPDHSWLLDFRLSDVAAAQRYKGMSPVLQAIVDLRLAKGNDYNNVPGGRDAYFPFGHKSYLHMLQTKTLRLLSLDANRDAGREPRFESTVDTVQDLINYATYYGEWLVAGKTTEDVLEHAKEA